MSLGVGDEMRTVLALVSLLWFGGYANADTDGERVMNEMLKDAAVILDSGMVWSRRLSAPVEDVWKAVSTSPGVQQWWLGGSPHYNLDLRKGGVFQHHWRSTVTDFEDGEYIDFANEPWIGGGMRIEVRADGDGTVFTFLVQGNQPAGPAAGWHGMIDKLEMYTTGKEFDFSQPPDESGGYAPGSYLDQLMQFYIGYMEDNARWVAYMKSNPGDAYQEPQAAASEVDLETPVGKVLTSFIDAISTQDVDAVLPFFSDDYTDSGGTTKASIRQYFEGLFAQGVLRGAAISIKSVDVRKDSATSTIAYQTGIGTAEYEYNLNHDGVTWRIVSRRPL